jgi:hypothetical protein
MTILSFGLSYNKSQYNANLYDQANSIGFLK